MARLIDADALKTEARKLENIGDNDFERVFCWGVDEVVNLIESAPTVDAEPVRHGQWIVNNHYGVIECTSCGYGRVWGGGNYCSYCGAKMTIDTKGE